MKQTHSFSQGSTEWAAHRSKYLNASDASAAMGLSRFKTRSELMREMATGITAEHDDATLARFAKGHEFEAIARPWAEEIIGEDLSPMVMSDEINGLPLSASFDGIDFGNSVTFEHKTANAALLAALEAGEIPSEYKPQMEQGLLISGATRCLFMASAGDKDAMRYAWYESDPDVRSGLLAAWKQFREDLANYKHIEQPPAIVVAPIDDLPALTVELVGQVTSSNLALFKSAALARIESINTNLQTDEDFAIAKKTVKFLDDGEKRLVLVKQQALSQTASIDELFRTMDALREEMKAKRLTLDKLVTAREASIKIEIMQAGKDALAAHIETLNKRLVTVQMPPIIADFSTSIKGKRNLESMRGAVDDLVAEKKIESNSIADRIQINLQTLAPHSGNYQHLFSDLQQIAHKPNDDFALLVRSRIEAEEKRKEDERERIRIEEEAKAEAKAKAEAEAKAKAKAEAEAKLLKEQKKAEQERLEAERKRIRIEEEAKAKAEAEARVRAEQKMAVKSENPADKPTIESVAPVAIQEIQDCQKTKISTEPLKITGKVLEVGNLEDGSGRGVRLEADGEFIAIIGMSEDECRLVSKWYGEEVEISIKRREK